MVNYMWKITKKMSYPGKAFPTWKESDDMASIYSSNEVLQKRRMNPTSLWQSCKTGTNTNQNQMKTILAIVLKYKCKMIKYIWINNKMQCIPEKFTMWSHFPRVEACPPTFDWRRQNITLIRVIHHWIEAVRIHHTCLDSKLNHVNFAVSLQ